MNCSGFRRRTARKVHVLAVVGVLGTLVACGGWTPDFSPGPGTLPTLGGKVSNAGYRRDHSGRPGYGWRKIGDDRSERLLLHPATSPGRSDDHRLPS